MCTHSEAGLVGVLFDLVYQEVVLAGKALDVLGLGVLAQGSETVHGLVELHYGWLIVGQTLTHSLKVIEGEDMYM